MIAQRQGRDQLAGAGVPDKSVLFYVVGDKISPVRAPRVSGRVPQRGIPKSIELNAGLVRVIERGKRFSGCRIDDLDGL